MKARGHSRAADHPFGLAPGIYQIPKAEWDDWSKFVGNYYLEKAAPFGVKAAEIALHDARETDSEHADIADAEFNTLVCEGLYSKFLSALDPRDMALFKPFMTDTDRFDYLKSDYSCMRVVKETHPGEAAAASVALVRRPKNDAGFNYEVVAIQLQHWNKATKAFEISPVFTSADGEAWRIARYFLLQGAIHRINLIDHTEVHFPPDAINAITKTVLPKDNLILRLLRPHMWLSMCVNNTVLEGQRSLINRNTWYPWSPFVAAGDEVRKLLPFGWYGSEYFSAKLSPGDPSKDDYFDEPNSSYPAYRYDPVPPQIPSRYGQFLNAYFAPVRKFVPRRRRPDERDRLAGGPLLGRPHHDLDSGIPVGRGPARAGRGRHGARTAICWPTRSRISSGTRRCAIRRTTRRCTR